MCVCIYVYIYIYTYAYMDNDMKIETQLCNRIERTNLKVGE